LALFSNSPKSPASKAEERDAAQQQVLMREIDDALREDEARAMFSRYAKPVGAAVVAGLLGLAGYLWYTNHQEAVAGENGEKFTLALDQVEGGDLAKGNAALAPLLKDAGPGYAGAARLMQGGIAEQQGKAAEAAKIFGEVAADANAPQPYRDLATIRAVAAQFDTLLPQQVVDRLKPLAVPGNPWFGSAGELVGVAYIKQGRGDLAAPLFAAIAKDKGVPDTLRRRIRQIAGQLGVDAVDDPEAAAHAGGQ
jgi:hypothetical protein